MRNRLAYAAILIVPIVAITLLIFAPPAKAAPSVPPAPTPIGIVRAVGTYVALQHRLDVLEARLDLAERRLIAIEYITEGQHQYEPTPTPTPSSPVAAPLNSPIPPPQLPGATVEAP